MLRHEWYYQHPGRRFPLRLFPRGYPLYLPPINIERGLTDMYVSWNDIFAFCTVILTVILVVYQMTNKEK